MAAANARTQQTGMTSEKLRETPGAKAAKPAPRRQKTAKYDRKLVEILRTAAAVFAEVGFDPASIRMVADRADVSVAGLYYYVHSKEELLYLIQYHVFDGLVSRFEADSERMLAEGEQDLPLGQFHRLRLRAISSFSSSASVSNSSQKSSLTYVSSLRRGLGAASQRKLGSSLKYCSRSGR